MLAYGAYFYWSAKLPHTATHGAQSVGHEIGVRS